jgi:hypothetical protein
LPISLAISLYALIINRLFREHWTYSLSDRKAEVEDREANRCMWDLGHKCICSKEWRKINKWVFFNLIQPNFTIIFYPSVSFHSLHFLNSFSKKHKDKPRIAAPSIWPNPIK